MTGLLKNFHSFKVWNVYITFDNTWKLYWRFVQCLSTKFFNSWTLVRSFSFSTFSAFRSWLTICAMLSISMISSSLHASCAYTSPCVLLSLENTSLTIWMGAFMDSFKADIRTSFLFSLQHSWYSLTSSSFHAQFPFPIVLRKHSEAQDSKETSSSQLDYYSFGVEHIYTQWTYQGLVL